MKSDNQYLFAYETLMNVQGNLRRSGKFKTYKSFLENSDRAYVNSLMKSYIEEKKWIQNIKANYIFDNNIQAPIEAGQIIGSIELTSNDRVVLTSPLVAIEAVEAKGFFGRLWSRLLYWMTSLFSFG